MRNCRFNLGNAKTLSPLYRPNGTKCSFQSNFSLGNRDVRFRESICDGRSSKLETRKETKMIIFQIISHNGTIEKKITHYHQSIMYQEILKAPFG